MSRKSLYVVTVTLCLSCRMAPEPVDLELFEESIFSQNGEDGVIAKIFELIQPTHRYAVEFGASEGVRLSNSRNLIVNKSWSALLIEGNESIAKKLHENYENNPAVKTLAAFVYPGNVELLFEENDVPYDFDLLSVDIDSNDYYVWRAIRDFRPKVVLIEFNGSFPPPQKMVIRFHPMNYWDGSDYFGASIQSLYELGKKKGYELIYCEKRGVNLFFVDKPYFERFGIKDNSPEKLYRLPQFGLESGGRAPNGRGHPISNKDLVWDEVRIRKDFILDRY